MNLFPLSTLILTGTMASARFLPAPVASPADTSALLTDVFLSAGLDVV